MNKYLKFLFEYLNENKFDYNLCHIIELSQKVKCIIFNGIIKNFISMII